MHSGGGYDWQKQKPFNLVRWLMTSPARLAANTSSNSLYFLVFLEAQTVLSRLKDGGDDNYSFDKTL